MNPKRKVLVKNPRKAERLALQQLDKMMEYAGAEYIFILPQIFDVVLSNKVLRKASDFSKSHGSIYLEPGAFQGYKLAIAVCLYNLLDAIVRNPGLIGIKFDDTFYDYWAFTKKQGRDKLVGGAKRGNDLPGITAKIQMLFQQLLEIRDWKELRQYRQSIQPLCKALKGILNKHFPYCYLSKGEIVASREYLLRHAPDTIRRDLLNSDLAHHVYAELYRKHIDTSVESKRIEDDDKVDDLTRFDDDWREGTTRLTVPQEWACGYAFALTQAMVNLASVDLSTRIHMYHSARYPIDSWYKFDRYEVGLDTAFGLLPPPFFVRLVKAGRITKDERAPLIADVKPPTDEVEFIRSRMGNRVRIVERSSPSAVFSFGCLLRGAVAAAKRRNEKVLISRIRHPVGNNEYDYSFGVLIPVRGGISNVSLWWIFYDVAADWNNEGSFALQKIVDMIRRNINNIDMLKLTAHKNKFYEFCEDPGYLRLRQQIVAINKLHSKIRGSLPELLLALYLAKNDAHPIHTRFKPKFLGKELDVIGCFHKNGAISEVVVFESKGRATTYSELEKELSRFSEKIQLVHTKWEDMAKKLGIPANPKPQITSVFVSMAPINLISATLSLGSGGISNTFAVNVPTGIELWDFNVLTSKLKEHGIPDDYINLLQEKDLAYEI